MKQKIIFLMILFFSILTQAQEKTTEDKISVDKKTGDTTYISSVIISETEDITSRGNLIVINPLKFLLFYNLSYFHKISDDLVIGGGIQVPTISGISGFGINTEARFYPKGNNMRGFYIAPNLSYNHLSVDDVSTDPFSLGILIGWQWYPGDQFAMGLGIGVDHYFGSVKYNNDDLGNYNGFEPALRFDINIYW